MALEPHDTLFTELELEALQLWGLARAKVQELEQLCPVRTLQVHKNKKFHLLSPPASWNPVLILYCKPHNPVWSAIIYYSAWIDQRHCMQSYMMLCKLDVIGSTRFTVTSAHTQTVARQLASSALQEADASSVLNRRRGCHLCKVFYNIELRAITTQMKVNCLFGSGGLVSCSMIAHH